MADENEADVTVRTVRRFTWNAVDPALIRHLLVAVYADHSRTDDIAKLRKLTDPQLRRQAEVALGSPLRRQHMAAVTDVLREKWLPTAPSDVVADFLYVVSLTLGGAARRAATEPTRHAERVAFLQSRHRTETFVVNLRSAFVGHHKLPLPVRGGSAAVGGAGTQSNRVLVGGGEEDSRTPFPHQTAAWLRLDEMKRARSISSRSGLLEIPTGGGKTSTMVVWLLRELARRPDLRVLWVADQQELIDQAAAEFEACGVQLPEEEERRLRVLHSKAGSISALADDQTDIVCTTRQSLVGSSFDAVARRRLREFLKRPCVVVIDEAHHAVSPSYQKLIAFLGKSTPVPMLIGLTATPWPAGAGMTRRLHELFPQTVAQVKTHDLIEDGYLARPVVHTFTTGERIETTEEERRQIGRGDVPDSVFRKLDRDSRNEFVVETWLSHRDDWGKTLVFACTVDHAEHLAEAFKRHNVATSIVHSRAEVERGAVIQKFRDSVGPSVLVSVNMLLEGVDIPSARTAFLCRPTMSRIVLKQMIGRVLRGEKAGGDAEAHLVDLADTWAPGVDPLRPVDIPGPFREADHSSAERRLPPVLADDGEQEIGRDILSRIESALAERVRVWGRTVTLTPMRMVGFYDLEDLRVPVFAHTEQAWRDLADAVLARQGTSARSFFDDLPSPSPLDSDITAFVERTRGAGGTPPFIALVSTVDVRAVARDLIGLGSISEMEKLKFLRRRFESSVAITAYESLQGFCEAVQTEVLTELGAIPTGSNPEHIRESNHRPRKRLTPLDERSLAPLFRSVVSEGNSLLLDEPSYQELLETEFLPAVDWTKQIVERVWAYWSWRTTTRARDKPVIRINLALRAKEIDDSLLRYLLWHELVHHLLAGRGHDAEFRRLEALWPDHLRLDHEIDTLHERYAIPVAAVSRAST